mmetsp:Transcript_8749/g.12951  ORF Transcript_8749/g.12951 Transcript_8749/m.12951 type:complete len:345 (+) Transcript_8749:157-1191(+)|eukprot:CAMPEP_0117426784 /NCGR_PEP_ID=MMETSP0758-20121206/6804_1 /TAXON_ID=63605 /ORGANISM="Percolomonas cosmopolitus, Strain AE-1 (ATCC 50343)" /LENGTH=344 /DNA_ID=CAMNT_0005212111 /DNA_START=31 /DNA_END=1065 /DNA_ORIENTATION=-
MKEQPPTIITPADITQSEPLISNEVLPEAVTTPLVVDDMSNAGDSKASFTTKQAGRRGLLLGAIASAIQQTASYPFDFLKVNEQLNNPIRQGSSSNSTTHVGRRLGMIQIAKHYYKIGGPFVFWRGGLPSILGAIPRCAVRFSIFEMVMNQQHLGTNLSLDEKRFFAGAVAGGVEALTVATITETIKTKLVLERSHPNFLLYLKESIDRIGVRRTFYQGATPTVIKQMINHSMRFSVTLHLRDLFIQKWGDQYSAAFLTICAGLFGGASCIIVTQPFDVLKTRMQSGESGSMVQCMNRLYKHHGIRGFYFGLVPRTGRVMMEVSILYTCYDLLKKLVYGDEERL